MGPIGGQEMVIIFIVALVLFGPKKLPELGRTVGKILTQFRHVSSDLKASFEREMQNLERETEAAKLKELGASAIQTIHEKANEFAYPYYDSSSESYDYVAAINPQVDASEVSGVESPVEPAGQQTIDVTPEAAEHESPEGTVARGSHHEEAASQEESLEENAPQHS